MSVKPKRKRSTTACTTCRRMKLKCDVTVKFPNKCSRCDKKMVFCEIDRSAGKVRALTPSTIGREPMATTTSTTTIRFNNGTTRSYSPNSNMPRSITEESNGSTAPINEVGALKEHVLMNGMVIDNTLVDLFFDLFMKYQYAYLPVFPKRHLTPSFLLLNSDATLTTNLGPVTIHTTTSPVLFWTICAVACPIAFHQGFIPQSVWDAITDHVRLLLQKHSMVTHYILRPFTALAHIYALVILCEWPLPHRTTQEDLTWIYSGQAVHIGLLVGLHRSWFRSEFVILDNDITKYEGDHGGNNINKKKKKKDYCRARMHALMWSACFHTNQRLASVHGVPATATLDYNILARFNDDIKHVNNSNNNKDLMTEEEEKEEEDLSEFIKQVHILHHLQRCINTLCIETNTTGIVDPNCRRLVHSSLEDTLSQLGVDYSPMAPMTELIFLHTKVQLHSFLLTPDTLDSDKIWVVTPISIVCMQLIQLVKSMVLDNDEKVVPHTCPNFIIRVVLISSLILFQLSTSKYNVWLDQEASQLAVTQGRSVLATLSWSSTCPAARGVRVLDGLANMASAGELTEDISFSQSRLGAGYWGIMMKYKKWLIKQQKQKQQQQDGPVDPPANYMPMPSDPPIVSTTTNTTTPTTNSSPWSIDTLSMGDIFGNSFHLDDNDNWNDLSWLDSYILN
ncbi:hypothetical protein BC941DRAFT_422507 [Chlamydoabsidia padenii]|nr:hypothetical protein BC941DRAFT_422507 [Chlamydoabsidia padenii]